MKAVLVNVDFLTRVVVDKIYDENDNLTEEFVNAVSLSLAGKLRNNEVEENISMIREDKEMPYSDDDKPKVDFPMDIETYWFFSSGDFVWQMGLESFAKELWGEDIFDEDGHFQSESDLDQMQELLEYLKLSDKYYAYCDDYKNGDDLQIRRYL